MTDSLLLSLYDIAEQDKTIFPYVQRVKSSAYDYPNQKGGTCVEDC